MPRPVMLKKLKLNRSMKTYKTFIIGDWNAKVGSQETPGITGKFGLGVWNEAGQRLTEFCKKNTLVTANTSSNNRRKDSTHGHQQMI